MQINTTPAVDAISRIAFTGDVIPLEWYKHLKMESGLPDTIGILLLARIVYWYKRAPVMSDDNDSIIGYKKKFKGDKLQMGYAQIKAEFGFSKDQARDALNRLKNKGLITISLLPVETQYGILPNVMFIEPVAKMLVKITFSSDDVVDPIPVGSRIKPTTPSDKTDNIPCITSETTTKITKKDSGTNVPVSGSRSSPATAQSRSAMIDEMQSRIPEKPVKLNPKQQVLNPKPAQEPEKNPPVSAPPPLVIEDIPGKPNANFIRGELFGYHRRKHGCEPSPADQRAMKNLGLMGVDVEIAIECYESLASSDIAMPGWYLVPQNYSAFKLRREGSITVKAKEKPVFAKAEATKEMCRIANEKALREFEAKFGKDA